MTATGNAQGIAALDEAQKVRQYGLNEIDPGLHPGP